MATTDPEEFRKGIRCLRDCIAEVNKERKKLETALKDLMESTKEGIRQNKQWIKEYSETGRNEPPKTVGAVMKNKRTIQRQNDG